jgi:flagellar basal-body rod protein FlgG
MTVQQQNMDVLANNIANADTTGFKRDVSVVQSFSAEMMRRLHDPEGINDAEIIIPWMRQHDVRAGNVSLGAFTGGVYTDFSAGRYVHTNGTFDLAINDTPRDDLGSNGINLGFFTVSSFDADGNAVLRYTRDGKFTVDQERVLRTLEGHTVTGVNNPAITVPDSADITIRDDGAVYVRLTNGDFQYIDHVMITSFTNLESLRKVGDNLYSATDMSETAAFTGTVLQGYLEGSNIKPVAEMVRMITVQRAYEMNQRAILSQDGTLQRAVNDIGRRNQ